MYVCRVLFMLGNILEKKTLAISIRLTFDLAPHPSESLPEPSSYLTPPPSFPLNIFSLSHPPLTSLPYKFPPFLTSNSPTNPPSTPYPLLFIPHTIPPCVSPSSCFSLLLFPSVSCSPLRNTLHLIKHSHTRVTLTWSILTKVNKLVLAWLF